MKRFIKNEWSQLESNPDVEVSHILNHEVDPEGLDFFRVRFSENASYQPPSDFGALVSVLRGKLSLATNAHQGLALGSGTHLFLPAHCQPRFEGQADAELVIALSPTVRRTRGTKLLLRDDQFLAACAAPSHTLRWILTPQYLSRRVFLHHDQTLLSRKSEPLSWFRTTMFDVDGLPLNDEAVPVFKMSYNFRTEPNLCYEVVGDAKVRMAEHPYQDKEQRWGAWQSVDDQTTYHLCEDSSMAQWHQSSEGRRPRRNKHEVRIVDGHVSLICMHDPAPTGAERHSSGEYSEYGDLAETLALPAYKEYLERLAPLDRMIDSLSLAKASGAQLESLPEWAAYQEGLAAQRGNEAALHAKLVKQNEGRELILQAWMSR